MNNQISFSWDLHYACNYRCPYCWFHGRWIDLSKQNRYLPVDECLRYWRNIYYKYGSTHIEILGGEPFIYPNFRELIKQLSKIHSIGITTNLSVSIDGLVKEISSSKIKIKPTYHPLFAKFEDFIEKVLVLKENQMGNSVFYLAYPPQLRLMKYYKERFSEYGISLDVMSFWGEYRGIKYPQGYTREEKDLLDLYLGKSAGEKFQLEPKKVKGKLCRAGQIYADIKADGTVFRCGGSNAQTIGNLFCDDFRLLDEPMPCESEFCPCNEWAFLLDEKRTTIEAEENKITLPKEDFEESHNKLPRFPRLDPPCRVYWNWDITYDCNYRCSYCIFWKEERYKQRYPYVGIDRWEKVWANVFEKYWCCHIRFSGGEPFAYPNFIDLVAMLSQRHTVDVTTNLTFDIDQFLKNINSGGITLSASFHPEFVKIDEFLDKVLLLNKKRFPTSVAYVAYPPHLADLEKYKSASEKAGTLFKIIPFIGEFEGKKYPQGYSEQQKKLLQGTAINAETQPQKEINTQWFNQEVNKNMSTKDKFCRMGQMYARILPNGDVTRCCHHKSERLGSILDDEFRLLDEPKVCNLESCPCWKPMIVGYQEDKYPIFWEMPEHKIFKLKKP